MDAARDRIVQFVDHYTQSLQRRNQISSPSRGTGISPASKKIAPRLASSAAHALISPIKEDLSCETGNMPLAVPLESTSEKQY